MAAHIRQQIRDNVVTALAGLTTTGARVYSSRVYPIATVNQPGLIVYTLREDDEIHAMGGASRGILRMLDVAVEAYVRGTADIDDTLDTIAREVEEKLALDLTRGALAHDTYPVSYEVQFSGEGDQRFGIGRMTFRVEYVTAQNDVDAAL